MYGANDTEPVGQQAWTTVGDFSFQVPAGVTSISAVVISGGCGGDYGTDNGVNRGGVGGSLRWSNSIPVTPGEILTIRVGRGGRAGTNTSTALAAGGLGGDSLIMRGSTVLLVASVLTSTPVGTAADGSVVGGGNGGQGGNNNGLYGGGAGGAGGYAGNGGTGGNASTGTATSGTGGAAGGGKGGASGTQSGGGSGGVDMFGQGASGAAATATSEGGKGGSGGLDGAAGGPNGSTAGKGGRYGGAGGGAVGAGFTSAAAGESGAVRVIWGKDRAYPSTRTADEVIQ